jgi:farnesyl diphosphate synthase
MTPVTTTLPSDLASWMGAIQTRIEAALARAMPAADRVPARLHSAMRYAVLEGGKRVRPLLAFAAGEVVQAPTERLDTVSCALEFIHAYSLVHDDMPCMDNDVLRRGKPTVHVEFDEATALLVGDSLQTLAFEVLSHAGLCENAATQLEMVSTLAMASGTHGMAGGQAIDLASTGVTLTLPELEFMHIHKTGALIRAAVKLGALSGERRDPSIIHCLDQYAKHIGLAFQVVDDCLDAEGTTATLGKTAGKDAVQGKSTYVSLLGLSRAKTLAEELRQSAHDAVRPLGPRAARLGALADFIVRRQF